MKKALYATLLLPLVIALSDCSGGGTSSPSLIPPTANTPASVAPDEANATVGDLSIRGFTETWSEFAPDVPWLDGTSHQRWIDQWNGYGTVDVTAGPAQQALTLSPLAATPGSHSALVTSVRHFANAVHNVTLTTRAQLSTNPQPWEVGWVLFDYVDNLHFYAFVPKPNGWELSKQDPAYPGGQRFLATASSPAFPIGVPYGVRIVQHGAALQVWVNGKYIVGFIDGERPYSGGSVGLYTEEAYVDFGTVSVQTL